MMVAINRNRLIKILFSILLIVSCNSLKAQEQSHQFTESWLSFNANIHLNDKWGIISEIQIRRNNFIANPGFSLFRAGAGYWINHNVFLSSAVAHVWTAPEEKGWKTTVNENNLYEQISVNTPLGRNQMQQRIRNEHRWQQVVDNDKFTGDIRYNDRIRYQLGFNFPLKLHHGEFSIVTSDEIFFDIKDNHGTSGFDQNRIYLGMRQKISKSFSYDVGYMFTVQTDQNYVHTLRLFFYYNPHNKAQQM